MQIKFCLYWIIQLKGKLNIFNKFKYSNNLAYLHNDIDLMPKSKFAWSSWNFINRKFSKNLHLHIG